MFHKRFLISILFFASTSLMAISLPGTCSLTPIPCSVDTDCPPTETCVVGTTNTPPTASDIIITGILTEGQTLSVSYTYSDPDTDPEMGTTFKWYRDNNGSGATAELITTEPFGSISPDYTLQAADVGKYMQVWVYPNDGLGAGTGVSSSWVGPVLANMVDTDGDGVSSDLDCDDTNPAIYPGNTEIVDNGLDDDCNASTPDTIVLPDADGDGVADDLDCDDTNSEIYPGNTETLDNGLDDDCNASTPDTIVPPDADGDGVADDLDCDDTNSEIFPGNTETLDNGLDDDCNPSTPDTIVLPDADQDGFNDYIDCDDTNPDIFPGKTEIVGNGINDDCNPYTFDEPNGSACTYNQEHKNIDTLFILMLILGVYYPIRKYYKQKHNAV